MRGADDSPEGIRLGGVIVVLWRAGLRISEALVLAETDLDRHRGAMLNRAAKGGKRREVGMDRWGWEGLDPWLELRADLPVGVLSWVLRGPTRGRPCAPAGIRKQLHNTARWRPYAGGSRHTSSDIPRGRDVPRGDPAPGHPTPLCDSASGASQAIESCKQQRSNAAAGGATAGIGQSRQRRTLAQHGPSALRAVAGARLPMRSALRMLGTREPRMPAIR